MDVDDLKFFFRIILCFICIAAIFLLGLRMHLKQEAKMQEKLRREVNEAYRTQEVEFEEELKK